eukprot:5962310-Pleurochrysis_carterae.AAC.3
MTKRADMRDTHMNTTEDTEVSDHVKIREPRSANASDVCKLTRRTSTCEKSQQTTRSSLH